MSGLRERILGAVRSGIGRTGSDAEAKARIEARIAARRRNLEPARANLAHAAQVALFERKAIEVAATVETAASLAEVPGRVVDFLARHNLQPRLRLSPDPVLDRIPWGDRPLLEIGRGAAQAEDVTGLTPALAGIAETGTLLLASASGRPSTLNFVPDNHIVVLSRDQVTGTLEDALVRLRAATGGAMPRTVNLISGPSRTADIEQQLVMGAHGPRRLHIILVDEPLA